MNSWEAEQLERLKKDYEKQERELKDKLAKKKAKLDGFLERDRDRALFDLAPRLKTMGASE